MRLRRSWWKHSRGDSWLVGLAVAHGCVLVLAASIPLIALGIWWNSNTIAHNFVHLPFFRSRLLNRGFSAYLSVLLGIPQRLWRDRHLAHHAGTEWRLRWSAQLLLESALVGLLWAGLLWQEPAFFWKTYLPGWVLGLALCQLQGYYEHARGTTSHYGRLYNFLFFNDGYHVEHHARPGLHWQLLPRCKSPEANVSRWPACLRWIEQVNLETLEKLVLRAPGLQKLVLELHGRALRHLRPHLAGVHNVWIVGGGLFPRTALILRQLLPGAALTVIDRCADHLEVARAYLGGDIELRHGHFTEDVVAEADLIVIPLSFVGNREALYSKFASANPGARKPLLLVHDWLWRPRGRSVIVSLALLKRLNLIGSMPSAQPAREPGHYDTVAPVHEAHCHLMHAPHLSASFGRARRSVARRS